ncbi:hypothetical protein DPMN_080038 [Dreissena polymorpha]|uniref:Uncharacterized protein n=1 Tax=Dreissena polymorpha TaxID=45954 RepID=A0A9D3YRV9_DREPO|nr:hypothetical protein DPMN_080038 [Dreissena polymorpha]
MDVKVSKCGRNGFWYMEDTKTTLTETINQFTFWSQKSSEERMAQIGTNYHQKDFEIVAEALQDD